MDKIYRDYDGKPIEILSPLIRGKKEYKNLLLKLRRQGYLQARVDGTVLWLEERYEDG